MKKKKTELLQAKFLNKSAARPLQRQLTTEEKETEPVQAKSAASLSDSFEAGDDVESRLSQSKGSGSPLPDPVRTYMEPRFGVDFSHVRVHTGSDAIQMNRDVGAQAFTHGSDIYYGAGSSPANLELTAHELTHIIQQTGSPPLQTKRLDEAPSANINPSLQRTCSMCAAGMPCPKCATNQEDIAQRRAVEGETGSVPPALTSTPPATVSPAGSPPSKSSAPISGPGTSPEDNLPVSGPGMRGSASDGGAPPATKAPQSSKAPVPDAPPSTGGDTETAFESSASANGAVAPSPRASLTLDTSGAEGPARVLDVRTS